MLTKRASFFAGFICGLAFAPLYLFPAIFTLSILCTQIYNSPNPKTALCFGYWFGFGFFLSALYWISFGIIVYIEEFWWALPFALLGLPAALALFVSIFAFITWYFRSYIIYHFTFCLLWVLMEWIMSWIFTGLPWALIGYSFCISDYLLQSASIFGILGLSFIAVFIGSAFFNRQFLSSRIILAVLILAGMIIYGKIRLDNNPTRYSPIKARIVQPSIPQTAKWDENLFWTNLNKQIELSQNNNSSDLIIWSEAALVVPFYYQSVYERLMSIFTKQEQILITGGVSDNGLESGNYEIYPSLIAINNSGSLLFDYHKSHLVPFGEYIPLKHYIPNIKKITHGFLDYSSGTRISQYLPALDLKIHPLICYESIFFNEVRILNTEVDLIINVTNDAWFGKSSGPFQHFEISKARAIENGLPMLRSGNNGISAFIDPVGRVLSRLGIDEINIIDGYIPYKLALPTLYSIFGNVALGSLIILVLILQIAAIYSCSKDKSRKILLE